MSSSCPRCGSTRLTPRRHGTQAAGTLGTIAGAASGATYALSETVTDSTLSFTEIAILTAAGAVLGGLAGGAIGCEVGAKMGKAVDCHILDNASCLDCGYTFSPWPV